MIQIFNFETVHMYGDVLPAMLRLRHREFVERLKYDVPTYNSMEYDQYDTPAAVYFVWRDNDNIIRASTRITPTHRPYMIKDIWPQSVQYTDLPVSPCVWEATRLFIDRNAEEVVRKQAHGEILCAYLEFALMNNIRDYIGVAPPKLWKHTFIKYGWPIEFVGSTVDIGYYEDGRKESIVAGMMNVSISTLENVRNTTGVLHTVYPETILPMERTA